VTEERGVGRPRNDALGCDGRITAKVEAQRSVESKYN